MRKALTTLLALTLCLTAGCGGDDGSPDEPAKAPPKTEKPAPAATSADAPTYAQVKKLALKDPKVAKLCADGGQDSEIGVGLADGETYTRLICDGNREVFDYVVGRKAFAKNFDDSVKLATYDLWKLDSDAYVTAGLFGPKTLADDIEAECGCGQTVKGGYGR